MRVVHVITRLILGGAQENTLYNVEDLVERHGDAVTLITGPAEGPEGDLFDRARKKNLDVRLLPELRRAIDPGSDWRAYRRLVSMIRELNPEVVHTHSSKAGILGRAAAAKAGVPAVIHTIHGLPFHPYERWLKNRIYIAAEKWAARKTDKIITVADAMIDQSVAAGVAPREKFITIFSGMEVEPFRDPPRSREEVREELGFEPHHVVIGKVARLFELKGHDDVIDAAAPLIQRNSDVHFLFVGGGIWRERLEAKVAEAGLGKHFHFTGLRPSNQIPELIGAMDIVVHASYREGLARVLPQALISGKPVVSYDVDGAKEVVLPDRTGYLVPPRDLNRLTESLWELVSDRDRREAYGRTGRELFTEPFRHERMTEQIRAVYEEILKRKLR